VPLQPEALISAHGYWVVLIGTFLEGETVLLLGGVAAHQGLLRLSGVIGCAVAGGLLGDQFFFWMGRWRGQAWIARRPQRRQRADRVRRLALQGGWPFMIGFRFLYGLRSITPLVLGASGYPPLRFTMLNTVGVSLWAVIVALAGFYLGHAAEVMLGRFRHDSARLLLVLVGIAVLYWLVRKFSRRHP
jgi:membrane protein DedA with SNARE-associated domain